MVDSSTQAETLDTILIVDDDEANRIALSALLNSEHSQRKIITAGSGEAALETLKTQPISLVLLDIQMPGMDGFATANAIRSEEDIWEVPILFMSASAVSDMDIQLGFSLGAFDYITKPFSPRELVARLKA